MSYLRFMIDLAIKEPIPDELSEQLDVIRTHIRTLKSYASKINEGLLNEEDTTRAKYHKCRHDEGLPCEEEQQI